MSGPQFLVNSNDVVLWKADSPRTQSDDPRLVDSLFTTIQQLGAQLLSHRGKAMYTADPEPSNVLAGETIWGWARVEKNQQALPHDILVVGMNQTGSTVYFSETTAQRVYEMTAQDFFAALA